MFVKNGDAKSKSVQNRFLSKNIMMINAVTLSMFISACGDTSPDDIIVEESKKSSSTYVLRSVLDANDERCPNGGVLLDMGIDTNGNNRLDSTEVTNTEVVCHGTNGTNGDSGEDGTSGVNGINGENGLQVLIVTTALSVGDTNCPTGGLIINTGIDIDSNSTLDIPEIMTTNYVCNGISGTTGDTGSTGAVGETGAKGDTGSTGAVGATGAKGDTGSTGSQGLDSLISSSTIGSGANACIEMKSGKDLNSNDILEESEVTDTSYLCTADTIIHNGVIYGAVDSSNGTGKTWLDRNLGASQACTSTDDIDCYGDYYQWGREADGHEDNTSSPTGGTSNILVNVGNLFIANSGHPYDWVNSGIDDNGALRATNWSAIDGSSVCPTGYRVPTEVEMTAETSGAGMASKSDAFNSFLKLPGSSKLRSAQDGSILGTDAYYWTATPSTNMSRDLSIGGSLAWQDNGRATGMSVRCIKN